MIGIRLMGGLGNQMFQYAAARSLASTYNLPIELDISWFDGKQLGKELEGHRRRYELSAFNIIDRRSSMVGSQKHRWLERYDRLRRKMGRGPSVISPHPYFIRESDNNFESDFATLKPPVYLIGYFQSERFFTQASEIIRREFTPKNRDIERRAADFRRSVPVKRLVGIHIRRGDYLHRTHSGTHVTPTVDYLTRAIAAFERHCKFLLISDDMEWAKTNISKLADVVPFSSGDSLTDLFHFASCDAFILSASSFSWWGCWLGDSRADKMVVAPKQWYGSGQIVKESAELCRSHWKRL